MSLQKMEEPLGESSSIKPEHDVSAVSVQSRLIPFWREIPRAWFIQFEAIVDPLKTLDDQKFRYVLQQLQTTDLQHITDILYNPPSTDKYGAVKRRLLTMYDKSDVKNFQKLISGLQLGDQKPTQLLRKMRELGTGMITEEGLKIEWLNHLPAQMRVVLSVNTESSLDTLAAMAAKMSEYSEPAVIAAMTTNPQSPVMSAQLDVLSKQMEKLCLEVAELRGRSTQRRRPPLRAFSRSRSRRRHGNKNSVRPGDPT